MTKEIKLLAGVTESNELYFLEIDPTNDKRNGYNEFSMCGNTVTPITAEEIEERDSNYLDGEELYFWKQAVEAGSTTESLDDWIAQVREEGGSVDLCSDIYPVDIDGTEYSFEYRSAGQHQEKSLKAYFIPETLYHDLMKAWDMAHLKDTDKLPAQHKNWLSDVVEHAKQEAKGQDWEVLSIKAIELINQ